MLAVVGFATTAHAHALGISRGVYSVDGSRVRVELVLRADEAAAVAEVDAGAAGLSAAQIAASQPSWTSAFVDALDVEADGERCAPAFEAAAPDAPDGLRILVSYTCPRPPAVLHLHLGFLARLPSGHRHVATVRLPSGDVDDVVSAAEPDVRVTVRAPSSHAFVSFVRAGIEHILTGFDHLAFLLALLLGATLARETRGRVASLLAMLTAFTVGHSASLAVATLGGWAPSARYVEPAVALSVAYVGAENLLRPRWRRRWLVTLPFGFVHGFALAGALLVLGLPRVELPRALLGFNLGVELGQVVVLAVLLPPLFWLARSRFYPAGARATSLGIVVAGVAWFVQRIV